MSIENRLEKLLRGRAGLKKAVWTESGSWAGPLREHARLSATVLGTLEPWRLEGQQKAHLSETIERRLSFMQWELESLIERLMPHEASAFQLLCHIFFDELGFTIQARKADAPFHISELLLDSVLIRRTASSTVGAVLFSWFAETVANAYGSRSDFLRVELVAAAPHETVRIIDPTNEGSLWLVDLSKEGGRVSDEEWQEWCEKPGALSRLSWAQGFARTIAEISSSLVKEETTESLAAQLVLLDQLIALEPSETRRWAERALLHYRQGEQARALEDLKRFFAFHDRETAPRSLVELYDQLRG